MGSIDFWRTTALGSVAIGQTLFVVLYCTFPWWKRFLGKALFFKAVALATLVDMYMVYRIFQFDHADVMFTVLYWLLGVGVWAQFAAFLYIRVNHRQEQAVSGNLPTHQEYR